MRIPEGQTHKNQLSEIVLISDPWFVKRTLENNCPDGNIPELEKEFLRLIKIFDKKELRRSCGCRIHRAQAIVFLKETLIWRSWCKECSPFWLERNTWKYHIVSDYRSALYYVERYCNDDRECYEEIIGLLANLKGLPPNPSAGETMTFFSTDEGSLPITLNWYWEKPPSRRRRPKKQPEKLPPPAAANPESTS